MKTYKMVDMARDQKGANLARNIVILLEAPTSMSEKEKVQLLTLFSVIAMDAFTCDCHNSQHFYPHAKHYL